MLVGDLSKKHWILPFQQQSLIHFIQSLENKLTWCGRTQMPLFWDDFSFLCFPLVVLAVLWLGIYELFLINHVSFLFFLFECFLNSTCQLSGMSTMLCLPAGKHLPLTNFFLLIRNSTNLLHPPVWLSWPILMIWWYIGSIKDLVTHSSISPFPCPT